ncbi:laccase domain protein [Campylobacterota bacterium]|nr:laccase domain protein [Campylobacterota bacterium]
MQNDSWFHFSHLASEPNLAHAITTRIGGVSKPPYESLNLAFHTGDDPAAVSQNRALAAEALGVSTIHFMDQIHSDRVVVANDQADDKAAAPQCDALIANQAGYAIGVLVADCLPILFYDPRTRSIGAAHAGRKGTELQIAAKTAIAMRERFGTNPADLLVGIGAGICTDCYEVGGEVAAFWQNLPAACRSALTETDGKFHIDLALANRQTLVACGVADNHIETLARCTRTDSAFFSFRREGVTGRFAALIALSQPRHEKAV